MLPKLMCRTTLYMHPLFFTIYGYTKNVVKITPLYHTSHQIIINNFLLEKAAGSPPAAFFVIYNLFITALA